MVQIQRSIDEVAGMASTNVAAQESQGGGVVSRAVRGRSRVARTSKHGCSELHVDLSDLSRFGLLDCRARQLAFSPVTLTFRAAGAEAEAEAERPWDYGFPLLHDRLSGQD